MGFSRGALWAPGFSQPPVLHQLFTVQLSPIQDQPRRTAAQPALYNPQTFNLDRSSLVPIDHVEVRRGVLTVIHADHDPEKPAVSGHV